MDIDRPPSRHLPAGRVQAWGEEELWAIRDTDMCAREELIRRFLPLARRLAMRYRSPNEPMEDLIQVANLGLVKAVDRFRPDQGTSFFSYAIPTILGELRRHFRDTGWAAHVPRGAQELSLRVEKAVQRLTDQTGRSPQVDEVAQFMELSMEDVLDGLVVSGAHFSSSLDAPVAHANDGEGDTTLDRIGGEDDCYALRETVADLSAGLRTLPHLERTALVLRFSLDLTQSEVAERMGCSQMQVSRLLARAAHRLGPPSSGR
jgi:RNA polymerase sigma-B factor